MKVKISSYGKPAHIAPVTLLGQMIEVAGDTVPGLLSERLTNPKFLGPANPQTGIAPNWQPAGNNCFPGTRYELTQGMSLSGNESQLIHNFSGGKIGGILQTGRWIRSGERLQVELWARAQHQSVTLRIGLGPLALRAENYDSTTICINATYWKKYQASLTAPCDNREAVFFCYIEGPGMVWFDQIHMRPSGTTLLREDLIERIRTLHIPVLRFPGGCMSTNYHWRHGTGPVHLRPAMPDPVFKWDTSYEFGTDEYLELCLKQRIQPQIVVNIGSGTPEEAGEWAAYCAAWYKKRGVEPPLIYWQMGNEHNGDWELGNMTGEMYAEALREFVPLIRKSYPKARIIAIGVDKGAGMYSGESFPWRKPMLEKAEDLIDVLAVQCYTGGLNEDKTLQHHTVFKNAKHIISVIQSVIDDLKSRGLKKRVAITEWNLWFYATHYDGKGFLEPYDVQHGLFVASMLHHFMRLAPALELANFYHLVNPMGIFISRGPEIEETLLADVFRLYRPGFPGAVVPLEMSSPALVDDIPAVDAACLNTSEARWLFLANRSLNEQAQIVTDALPDVMDSVTLVGDTPEGSFETVSSKISGSQVNLPPLSLTRLRMKKQNG